MVTWGARARGAAGHEQNQRIVDNFVKKVANMHRIAWCGKIAAQEHKKHSLIERTVN